MNIEYEIKVLDINVPELKKLLKENKFEYFGLFKFQRYIFSTISGDTSAWVRLRTDGDTTTLTYKKVHNDSIDGVEEIETIVEDFEKTAHLLKAAGLKCVSYQENTRELYKKGGVEISIDRWPNIPPYAEIEAKDRKTVERLVQDLGFSSRRTTSASTKEVYKLFGKNLDSYPELRF